jgi:hypothetical protein
LPFVTLVILWACGARSPLREPPSDGPDECGDGIDNNGDGRIDEGCPVCLRAGVSPWQVHQGGGPLCFGRRFMRHGDPEMYRFEQIPLETDMGWRPVSSLRIDFMDNSTLCTTRCSCFDGGDFTYFQSILVIPSGVVVRSFEVLMSSVDDGARVTVFNERFASGQTDPGAYAFYPSGVTARLESLLVTGRNRIVVSHVDDCCSTRALQGVSVQLNGGSLEQCR